MISSLLKNLLLPSPIGRGAGGEGKTTNFRVGKEYLYSKVKRDKAEVIYFSLTNHLKSQKVSSIYDNL